MIQLIPHSQITDYDRLEFHVVPFMYEGKRMYTLVEEKVKDGKILSDSRRQMDSETFSRLAFAIRDVTA